MTAKQLTKKIDGLEGRIKANRGKRQQLKAEEDQWNAEVKELRGQLQTAKEASGDKPRAGRKAKAKVGGGGDSEE